MEKELKDEKEHEKERDQAQNLSLIIISICFRNHKTKYRVSRVICLIEEHYLTNENHQGEKTADKAEDYKGNRLDLGMPEPN